jgi:uncharacterized protein
MPILTVDRTTIINTTFFLEGALLLVGIVWIGLAQLNLHYQFFLTPKLFAVGVVGGLALASSGFVIFFLGKLAHDKIKWITNLRQIVDKELAPLFTGLRFIDIFLIALSSGFCEEAFFRGILQTETDLFTASVVFGLVHLPNLKYFPYGLWAFAAGLFLGLLFQATGSIYVPMLAHGISNFISICYMRYRVKPVAV